MTKTKTDYILRSITKVRHKRWEFFVITRILHKLDDSELEFVTQQLVRQPDGSRYLTDLYFPQLELHLEINEPYHKDQVEKDFKREQDIVLATKNEVKHINIKDLTELSEDEIIEDVCLQVDRFVELVKKLKNKKIEDGKFTPWDWSLRYSAEPIIERGYLDVSDNVMFRLQIEALRCFGFSGKAYQRGAWTIPDGTGDWVWFPRLYEHYIWRNELSPDGNYIYERAINDKGRASIEKQVENARSKQLRNAIVFAKAKDSLGSNVLRYVGTFRQNLEASNVDVIQFDKVRDQEYVRVDHDKSQKKLPKFRKQ